MRKRHHWTPEEDARMLALVAAGNTQRQTSVLMGLNFMQVRRRYAYLRAGPTNIYTKGLICSRCPKPLSDLAKGDLCRSCKVKEMNADPEFQRRRHEGITKKWEDPAHRAKITQQASQISARYLAAHPEWREELRKHGRHIARTVLHRPDVRALTLSPEVVARRAKTQSDTLMAWCPPEYRDQYRWLTTTKQIRAPEARRMILEEVAAKQKAVEQLSPFERQMRALERGGQLVANDSGPRFGQPVDHGEAKWVVGR